MKAKVIEFYIPATYRPKTKYVPLANRGKLLEFKR